MKRTLMRRQVLKLVAGMALSPWPLHAASTQTVRVQQTAAALLAATEEGSLLQIDLEDLCHTLWLPNLGRKHRGAGHRMGHRLG